MEQKTNSTVNVLSLVFILTIGTAVILSTLFLPGLFIAEAARPLNYERGIGYVCLLEFIITLYALLPCFSGAGRRIAMSAYSAIAFPLFLYLITGIATVYLARNDYSLFITLVIVESIVFLLIAGSIMILGHSRAQEVEAESAERAGAYRPALEIKMIRSQFPGAGISNQDAGTLSDALRRLEERAESATRFGRKGAEQIESKIQNDIAALSSKTDALKANPSDSAKAASLKDDIINIVKLFDMRERSLVQ